MGNDLGKTQNGLNSQSNNHDTISDSINEEIGRQHGKRDSVIYSDNINRPRIDKKIFITKSLKIIDLVDNRMVINMDLPTILKDVDFPVKIISIMGQARLGKSSFMNLIISHMTGENHHIFDTSSVNQHCTKGIDCCVVKPTESDHGYVFLDCQGINQGDSSSDVKLLLLPYLLSDLIIFNDTVLNNSTLKALEPLMSLCNYVDIDDKRSKPRFVFRIKDYYLDTAIHEVLENTLADQKDQYQSIRNTIKTMFDDLTAIHTEQLDKPTMKRMKQYKYIEVIEEDNGFLDAIKSLIGLVEKGNKTRIVDNNFFKTISESVETINSNKKIDYTKFDVYTLLLRNDLNEFVMSIDRKLYEDIKVSGLQSDYDITILPRKNAYDSIIRQINTQFSKVDPTLKQEFLTKLQIDISDPINYAMNQLINCTYKKIKTSIDTSYDNCISDLDSLMNFDTYKSNLYNQLDSKASGKNHIETFMDYVEKKQNDIKSKIKKNLRKSIKCEDVYSPMVHNAKMELNEFCKELDESCCRWTKDLKRIVDTVMVQIEKMIDNICMIDTFDNLEEYPCDQYDVDHEKYFKKKLMKNMKNMKNINIMSTESHYNCNEYWGKMRNIKSGYHTSCVEENNDIEENNDSDENNDIHMCVDRCQKTLCGCSCGLLCIECKACACGYEYYDKYITYGPKINNVPIDCVNHITLTSNMQKYMDLRIKEFIEMPHAMKHYVTVFQNRLIKIYNSSDKKQFDCVRANFIAIHEQNPDIYFALIDFAQFGEILGLEKNNGLQQKCINMYSSYKFAKSETMDYRKLYVCQEDVKNTITKYFCCVDKKYTYDRILKIFSSITDGYLVIDFGLLDDDDSIKSITRRHVVDDIGKYYIDQYINSM
jgi:hypothetical protein